MIYIELTEQQLKGKYNNYKALYKNKYIIPIVMKLSRYIWKHKEKYIEDQKLDELF